MHLWIQHLVSRRALRGAVIGAAGLVLVGAVVPGCAKTPPPKVVRIPYPDLGPRPNLPPYLKETVLERTDVTNTGPLPVTSYALAVNLRNTGDSQAPTRVREWMIKEMYRHGWGSKRMPGFENLTPERVLMDKRVAIVTAGAYIPPGARKGQRVDVFAQALPQSDTASLSGGMLYQTELRLMGADPLQPGGAVNRYVEARGPLFVNPAYALETPKPTDGVARNGARTGMILGGGIVTTDRPLQLRLRTPQYSLARSVETVINQRFQSVADRPRQDGKGMCVAEAQDEGYLNLYPPVSFKGNWEHFAGVATHVYMTLNTASNVIKAQDLTRAATQPGALLEDISYALEAIGPQAIPYMTPLLNHPAQDVRYAMARAGAYLGDTAAENALLAMARQTGHPFRLNAILTLGDLPNNSEINMVLAGCLDSSESLIRIGAYKILAASRDPHIQSIPINDTMILDVIDSNGPPLIYATRVGEPRLVIFGAKTALKLPVTFSAFDTQLTIMTHPTRPGVVSIFYRGEELAEPVQTLSQPRVYELVGRLAGMGDGKLHFGYGDIVAMLQSMTDSGKVGATFVLEDQPAIAELIADTPDTTGGREVGEPAPAPTEVGVNTKLPAGSAPPQGRPN